MEVFRAPRVSLIARPEFLEPEHLRVQWQGSASAGERLAEFAGRICYMSQHNPANRSTADYLENIKKQGHGSVLEHAVYVLLIEGISRSCSHELVRHRAGFGYSQLSQRYVDESHAAFVVPPAILGDAALEAEWERQVAEAQVAYVRVVEALMQRYVWVADKGHRRKMAREAARSVLPNATEVKIVVSGNARAWRTMLELRCGEGAELEIRRMAIAGASRCSTRCSPTSRSTSPTTNRKPRASPTTKSDPSTVGKKFLIPYCASFQLFLFSTRQRVSLPRPRERPFLWGGQPETTCASVSRTTKNPSPRPPPSRRVPTTRSPSGTTHPPSPRWSRPSVPAAASSGSKPISSSRRSSPSLVPISSSTWPRACTARVARRWSPRSANT